jgi:hypothetical protein
MLKRHLQCHSRSNARKVQKKYKRALLCWSITLECYAKGKQVRKTILNAVSKNTVLAGAQSVNLCDPRDTVLVGVQSVNKAIDIQKDKGAKGSPLQKPSPYAKAGVRRKSIVLRKNKSQTYGQVRSGWPRMALCPHELRILDVNSIPRIVLRYKALQEIQSRRIALAV